LAQSKDGVDSLVILQIEAHTQKCAHGSRVYEWWIISWSPSLFGFFLCQQFGFDISLSGFYDFRKSKKKKKIKRDATDLRPSPQKD
jgi:hypothetical protein